MLFLVLPMGPSFHWSWGSPLYLQAWNNASGVFPQSSASPYTSFHSWGDPCQSCLVMGGESLIRLNLRTQRSLLYLNNSRRNLSLKLTPWAFEFTPCPVVSHSQGRISTIAQSKNNKISGWDSPFLPKAWNSRWVLLSICSDFSQHILVILDPENPQKSEFIMEGQNDGDGCRSTRN